LSITGSNPASPQPAGTFQFLVRNVRRVGIDMETAEEKKLQKYNIKIM